MSKRSAKLTRSRSVGRTVASGGDITGAQIRAARALLRLSQKGLSALSNVSNLTIVRMEATEGAVTRRANLVASIVAALSRQGIRFVRSDSLGEGALLKRRRRCRP